MTGGKRKGGEEKRGRRGKAEKEGEVEKEGQLLWSALNILLHQKARVWQLREIEQ